MTITVRLGLDTRLPVTHRYSLRCNPAGGTMPHADDACAAVADYLRNRSQRSGGCLGFLPHPQASATVVGTFADHRLRLHIIPFSWCGASRSLMRDYWILSTFPCSTTVFHTGSAHPYSRGVAPAWCLPRAS
jgi:hypothetical protein